MMEVILLLMFQMVLAAKCKESIILPLIAFPSGYWKQHPANLIG